MGWSDRLKRRFGAQDLGAQEFGTQEFGAQAEVALACTDPVGIEGSPVLPGSWVASPTPTASLFQSIEDDLLAPISRLLALQEEFQQELEGNAALCPEALSTHRTLTRALRDRLQGTLAIARLDSGLPLNPRPFAFLDMVQARTALWSANAVKRGVTLDLSVSPDVPRGLLVDGALLESCLHHVSEALIAHMQDATLCMHISPGEGCVQFDLAADTPADPILSNPAFLAAQALARHLHGVLSAVPGSAAGQLELELLIPARAITIGGTETPFAVPASSPLKVEVARMDAPTIYEDAAPACASSPTHHAGTSLHLGLAEDVVVNQQVFAAQVAEFGACVSAHNCAETLLAAHADAPFDVIVMDLHMPGMGGLAAIEALRQANDATPIIAYTADGNAVTHAAAMDAGADVILSKPLTSKQLGETLVYCADMVRLAA